MTEAFSGPVLIDGATGYVGSHLTAFLRGEGVPVRCLVHTRAGNSDIEFLKTTGAEIVTADLDASNNKELDGAFAGIGSAVHLIGSIAPRKGEKLSDLHGKQTGVFVDRAKASDVSKIVMVSAAGTRRNAPSTYHSTKWQAEECVRQSGLEFVILRPSLIAGRTSGRRNSKLVDRYNHLIDSRPVVPLLGGGGNLIQPIFVGDLVRALARAIASEEFNGQTIELGGPDVLTMKEFVTILMEIRGVKKSFLEIHPAVAGVLALICEAVQDRPLVSRDQVVLSGEDNLVSANALESKLGVRPTPVKESLASYTESQSNLKAGCSGSL